MYLKSIELSGFKSFAKRSELQFTSSIAGIVGPNGSGKSNTAEAFRFVLGEQSIKSMRGKRGPDLIWMGNEQRPAANRARVAIIFDNRDHLLDIDFDEVVLERVVHRDGVNEYAINGSKVRLKDIIELLASANIGASGHHIISQGEADRILCAGYKERREMIEDALGLKTYQFKKKESIKKLSKTSENIKEVTFLRRELAPQLILLERQMKKLERVRQLKSQMNDIYASFIVHERAYLQKEENRTEHNKMRLKQELRSARESIMASEQSAKSDGGDDPFVSIDRRLSGIVTENGILERSRGRIEGQIELLEKNNNFDSVRHDERSIPLKKVKEAFAEIQEKIDTAENITVLVKITQAINMFLARIEKSQEDSEDVSKELPSLRLELNKIQKEHDVLTVEETELVAKRSLLMQEQSDRLSKEKEYQQHLFELREIKSALERDIEVQQQKGKELEITRTQLTKIEWQAQDNGVEVVTQLLTEIHTREDQAELLREIERIEAKLEEAGGINEEIVHEYNELRERDVFLEREVKDLELSKKTLLEVIDSLDTELVVRFEDGLQKINEEFKSFFSMLFDGGHASLALVQENDENDKKEETKEGIEIKVQLPRKKVTTLDVLSGGERAMTSIALIFAMSQVNPPPFIILDETDAALDEANSRRYADIVKVLSKRSQLILITHNRQTMEAAGELYGVTMGSDGISKLLSVKFDEAVSVAK